MQTLAPEHIERIKKLRLVVFDIDGIFTDGRILLGSDGQEFNTFHTLDGQGIKLLRLASLHVAVISGRQSIAAKNRMIELGITDIYQGVTNKLATLQALLTKLDIQLLETAYIGDDLPDLPCLRAVGFSATVPNAAPSIPPQVDWQSTKKGGEGAVREFCELILTHQKKWDQICENF